MKKHYNLFALIFFTLVHSFPLKGQFVASSPAGAQTVKDNILAVVVETVDEKGLKKLKEDDIAAYKKELESFNQYLKGGIDKEWTFSGNVTYITKREADSLRQEKNAAYCILQVGEASNYKMGDSYSTNSSRGFNSPRDQAYHFSQAGNNTALTITWAAEPKKEIVTSYLPSTGLSLGAVTYMLQHLQHQLKNALDHNVTKVSQLKKEVDKRTPQLQNKTLLLYDPLISRGMEKQLDKNNLGKFYDYGYKKVDIEQVEKAIIENDGTYAYTCVIPAGAENRGAALYNYFIIDAADGSILYMTGQAVAGAHGKFHFAQLMMANKKIKK